MQPPCARVSSLRQLRAPLHLCSISLTPHVSAVASRDGHVFEANVITQLCRRTGLNPITGRHLSPDQLVPLKFTLDPATQRYCCPVLRNSFDAFTKVVVIATTGNVYSYAALQKLNFHPGTMRDLITNTPFALEDIIVLYDPALHVWLSEAEIQSSTATHHPFSYVTQPQSQHGHPSTLQGKSSRTYLPPTASPHLSHQSPNTAAGSLPSAPIREPSASRFASPAQHATNVRNTSFQSATNQSYPLPQSTAFGVPPNPTHASSAPPALPPVPLYGASGSASHHIPSQVSQTSHPLAVERPLTNLNRDDPSIYPHPATLMPAQNALKRHARRTPPIEELPKKPRVTANIPPLPPSAPDPPVDPQTSMAKFYQKKKEEQERKMVYKKIRKGKKGKGYVRVVTNIGHLNIELHCDRVPTTCDNFLTLAERKYYDGLPWHRVVPGFIAQTGDPTGTGEGGQSAWGGCIKDEIRTNLTHNAAGVVSMANSGRDTNRSQWFICFDAASHLDGCHTVFGKVVGGLYVLQKMESEAEMGHPLTLERIEVLVNPVRQARQRIEKEKAEHAQMTALDKPPPAMGSQDVPIYPPSPQVDCNSKPVPLHPQFASKTRLPTDKKGVAETPNVSYKLPSVRCLMNAAAISPAEGRCQSQTE
ncbi:Peptidyl-prolyl cis-trans isomerase-like 2 [Gracilariopsis chorda]|uniref:Peptidyl-prolyl cis-trans isomerase-like 2 n=1 Tax=Gracilariopsis chorda TaxID=448386 RepID=A0A2V3IVM6_9FLOR|nr:Peptidyl-prolyl cis-trans isomerase-like 2 [Gracilariopsis chorda]|eukprot:PXF46135.1 Peptidyl-prolyl cis-trans isomerase-like 2 [Gracilariopsis chorda]